MYSFLSLCSIQSEGRIAGFSRANLGDSTAPYAVSRISDSVECVRTVYTAWVRKSKTLFQQSFDRLGYQMAYGMVVEKEISF